MVAPAAQMAGRKSYTCIPFSRASDTTKYSAVSCSGMKNAKFIRRGMPL